MIGRLSCRTTVRRTRRARSSVATRVGYRISESWTRPPVAALRARNVGIRAAAGECFTFCDVDDEVVPGWVAAMSAVLAEHELDDARAGFATACGLDLRER